MRLPIISLAIASLAVAPLAGAVGFDTTPGPSSDLVQPVGMNLLAGFIPPVVVSSGGTVTWVNNDLFSATHAVTGILGAPPGSGDVLPGATYTATFSGPGVVPYTCTYHPWMNGVVVVT